VHVPGGEHVVEMSYRPAGFLPGLVCSTLALVVVAAIGVRARQRRASDTPVLTSRTVAETGSHD
jgi:hypothetical protein